MLLLLLPLRRSVGTVLLRRLVGRRRRRGSTVWGVLLLVGRLWWWQTIRGLLLWLTERRTASLLVSRWWGSRLGTEVRVRWRSAGVAVAIVRIVSLAESMEHAHISHDGRSSRVAFSIA